MDLVTKEGARARYARVCVEVDLTKPLLGKYVIDNRVFLRRVRKSVQHLLLVWHVWPQT
ncbi:hypothetical protein LINPERHAP1_LOCUS37816 [Linum perenne]